MRITSAPELGVSFSWDGAPSTTVRVKLEGSGAQAAWDRYEALRLELLALGLRPQDPSLWTWQDSSSGRTRYFADWVVEFARWEEAAITFGILLKWAGAEDDLLWALATIETDRDLAAQR